MLDLHVGDSVRLRQDVPRFALQAHTEGVIQSIWHLPADTYEVEFDPPDGDCPVRVLLGVEQLEVRQAVS